MKRSIVIVHNDETPDIELELAKASVVHTEDKGFVYLEKMNDGKWRLTYTSNTIPDFSKVAGFRVLREDDELVIEEAEVDGDGMRMKASGEPARNFMKLLIELFEQNGGKNFLCMTAEMGEDKRYGIEIRNLNGEFSAAEKLQKLENELAYLGSRLTQVKEIVDTIPKGGSKEGRPDYVSMLTSDKVLRLRELTAGDQNA